MKRFTAILICLFAASYCAATVPTTYAPEVKTCNGTTTSWTFSFTLTDTTAPYSGLKVAHMDSSGTVTVLSETTDYTVSTSDMFETGGTITTGVAYDSGDSIIIYRDESSKQASSFSRTGSWQPRDIETMGDALAANVQELDHGVQRALRAPVVDGDVDMELPNATNRASTTLTFDADGDLELVAGLVSPDDVTVSAFWKGLLPGADLATAREDLTIAADAVSVAWYGAVGDGETNDTDAFQDAIDEALSSGRSLYVPEGTYRINTTLYVKSDATHYQGFRWVQSLQAKLIWGGADSDTMIACQGVDHTHWVGLYVDGNDVTGSKGLYLGSTDTWSAQHHLFELCRFYQFKGYGTQVTNSPTGTCDYVTFEQCQWWDCKNALEIYGGARQISFQGGSIINSTEHGIYLSESAIDAHGLFLGVNATADVYLPGQYGSFQMFGCMSESETIIKTSSTGSWPDSKHYPPNILSGMNQSPNPDWPEDANSILYDSSRPLKLEACKFIGTVWIGSNSGNVVESQVDFWNPDYPSAVGYTGANADRRLTFGDGTQGNTTSLSAGVFEAVVSGGNWPLGVTIYDVNDTAPRTFYFADTSPDDWGSDDRRYYFRRGDVVWNMNPSDANEPVFWSCLTAGDLTDETTYADFTAHYSLDAKGDEDYTASNAAEDRTFDCDSTTVAELADVLATLIGDLEAAGIVQ